MLISVRGFWLENSLDVSTLFSVAFILAQRLLLTVLINLCVREEITIDFWLIFSSLKQLSGIFL